MHAIGWLPRGVSDRRAAALAATEGVETVPLSSFYATQSKRSGLVLGFAAFDEREIHVGVQKLARALALLKRE